MSPFVVKIYKTASHDGNSLKLKRILRGNATVSFPGTLNLVLCHVNTYVGCAWPGFQI